MRERLRDLLERLSPTRRRLLQGGAALVTLLLGAVLVATALPDRKGGQDPGELIVQVHASVEEDLYEAVLRLPPQVVRKLSDDGSGMSGTIAVRDGDSCTGFTVEVGEEYVLRGEQEAVEVGEIQELPAQDCEANITKVPTVDPETESPAPSGDGQ